MPTPYRHQYSKPNTQGMLLYLLPSPLFIKLIFSLLSPNLMKLSLTLAALFFFYSAAHFTRNSLIRLQSQAQYRPKKIKDQRLWAAIYVTVGVLILMFMIRRPPLVWAIMCSSAFMGYYLLYGLPQKPDDAPVDFDNMPKATGKAIKAAYEDLENIEALSEQLDKNTDKALAETLDKVLEQSYMMMDLLVKTPEDAGRARRFLNVYINRIKEILQQYIKLSKHGKADNLRQRLTTTLAEVEQAFREKKSQLLDDDIFKLDIQLEVLDEQIRQED